MIRGCGRGLSESRLLNDEPIGDEVVSLRPMLDVLMMIDILIRTLQD